jgi:hypothetical protein
VTVLGQISLLNISPNQKKLVIYHTCFFNNTLGHTWHV